MDQDLITAIWPQVVLPVIRITFFITLGLFIANFIESLNWTHRLDTGASSHPRRKIVGDHRG